jgi:hypothetical protein
MDWTRFLFSGSIVESYLELTELEKLQYEPQILTGFLFRFRINVFVLLQVFVKNTLVLLQKIEKNALVLLQKYSQLIDYKQKGCSFELGAGILKNQCFSLSLNTFWNFSTFGLTTIWQ